MTKAQARRKAAYYKNLRKCGFRSWKQANARRCDLINRKFDVGLTPEETAELAQLQKTSGLRADWKTNDGLGRCTRKLQRLIKKIEANRREA